MASNNAIDFGFALFAMVPGEEGMMFASLRVRLHFDIARATCAFHKSSLHFRYIKRQNMNPFGQHFARVASVATSPL